MSEQQTGMTFWRYIQKRRNTRGPAGDFVRDAKADETFPRGMVNWRQVKSYLISQHAIPEAIEAGHDVWAAYARRGYIGDKPA